MTDDTSRGRVVPPLDLADRTRAEAALAEKAAELETLLEAVPAAVWFTRDSDARHIVGNAAAQRLLRLPSGANASLTAHGPERPSGFRVLDREGREIPAESLPVQRAARGEVINDFEEELAFEDGTSVYLIGNARPIRDSRGAILGAIAAFADITARRETERALQSMNDELHARVAATLAERDFLATLVETTDALVIAADLEYRWLAVNRAAADDFERLFGVRPRIGESMLAAVNAFPEARAQVQALWSRALAGEEFTEIAEFGDPGSFHRWYEIKFNTLRDRTGRRIGAFQIVTDITRRREDERKLREAQETLRHAQKMEAVGQLTGGVAHDFNNLLAAILGGLTLLERNLDPERRALVMDGMRKAAERGAALTRQMLAFSRHQPLLAHPFDPGERLTSMRDMMLRALGGETTLDIAIAPDLGAIVCDPNEFELAVLNLCVNARDAMDGAGTVRIVAAPMRKNGADTVAISVSDHGAGMSEAVKARAFEPFFTTKDVGKGSGLGLSQVYACVQNCGGQIEIETGIGRGTRVTLLFPRSNLAPARDRSGAERATSPGAPSAKRILLVEDDPDLRPLTAEHLRQVGHSVDVAQSCAEALAKLRQDRTYDLVLSDVVMPGGANGRDLAQIVRATWPDLPILLTTGHSALADAAERDGFRVLRKPYLGRDWLDTIEAAARP